MSLRVADPLTDDEIKDFTKEWYAGLWRHIPSNEYREQGMLFLMLGTIVEEHPELKEKLTNVHIFGDMRNIGPRAINGRPWHLGFKILQANDAVRAQNLVKKMSDAAEKVLGVEE